MYITREEYGNLYDPMDEKQFSRFSFDAFRVMDNYTTGIDGVKKLRRFFPVDEYSVAAVKHCAAKLINLLFQLEAAENAASGGRGYTETEQGMRGKIISSITAGNESISFSTAANTATVIDAAAKDRSVLDDLLKTTVKESLSGVTDANEINLLFMGEYPRRYLC